MAKKKKKATQADKADRHVLYQQSVQDVVSEIDFVQDAFLEYRGRRALVIREDFSGTANTACEWVRRADDHEAFAVDLDPEVLNWGRRNNVAALTIDQQQRIDLLEQDVRYWNEDPLDAVLAMNFSYYLFLTRDAMREYFVSVHDSLIDDGLFFLDGYGGYDAPREIVEPRDCGDFTYIWEQASFNPIDGQMQCYIHFEFPDGSRLDRAFTYYWRLWTLPEIRELLTEAGFSKTWVYCEGTDEKSGEGNGEFTQTERTDADAGWICYIVAEK
jgi:SAM-dependent methyltransferase